MKHGFAQRGSKKDSVSEQGSSRWRVEVLPVVGHSSLSCPSVLGIVAQHHCVVPEMAVLLCVLTDGESSPPHFVIYLRSRSSAPAICVSV